MKKKIIAANIACSILAILILISNVFADAGEKEYQEASQGFKALEVSKTKRIFRTNWVYCAGKFEHIYKKYPKASKAGDAMYMEGKVYQSLYAYSNKESDLDKAVQLYQRMVESYPESKMADDAQFRTAEIYEKYKDDKSKAYIEYSKVISNFPKGNVTRKAELSLDRLKQFKPAVVSKRPSLPKKGQGAIKKTKKEDKIISSVPKGGDTIKNTEEDDDDEIISPLAKGEGAIKKTKKEDKIISSFPKGDDAIKNTKKEDETTSPLSKSEGTGLVTGIKYWSNPNYTRVAISVDKKVSYDSRLLRRDPSIQKPKRLYIDLFNTRISPELIQPILIQDGLLKMARAGQYTKDCVRVVLDIESIKSYKILPLEDPFRIIIDVIGQGATSKEGRPMPEDAKSLSLSRQLGLGIGKIVIDPGHGGHDSGAIGPSGLKEKDVVLKIARKLEGIIKGELGCEVVLTRKDDRFIPLEERTAIANTQKADLFVSIHANASLNRDAHGVETYFLNVSADEEAMKVAARENATSTKKMSDLRAILRDLMLNSKINESSLLAGHIQKSLAGKLKAEYSDIKDNGVKQAPFYVLIGAEMPSILAEVSFISNRREEERLKDNEYLERLASSIFTGIRGYIDGIKVAGY